MTAAGLVVADNTVVATITIMLTEVAEQAGILATVVRVDIHLVHRDILAEIIKVFHYTEMWLHKLVQVVVVVAVVELPVFMEHSVGRYVPEEVVELVFLGKGVVARQEEELVILPVEAVDPEDAQVRTVLGGNMVVVQVLPTILTVTEAYPVVGQMAQSVLCGQDRPVNSQVPVQVHHKM
jgi:hypothetical protein